MTNLDGLGLLDRDDLIAMVKRMVNGGASLSFHGKRTPWRSHEEYNLA